MDFSHNSIPEYGVSTFENTFNLKVTIHDLEGSLLPHLNPKRQIHIHSPLCKRVKDLTGLSKCHRFDVDELRDSLYNHKEGLTKLCHGGLIEWVLPVFGFAGLKWVFFAGQIIFNGECKIPVTIEDTQKKCLPNWSIPHEILPGAVGSTISSEQIMEHLKQLAARIQNWYESSSIINNSYIFPPGQEERKSFLIFYLSHNYTHRVTLKRISEDLNLSSYRVSHLIKELFGKNLTDLLLELRLKSAVHKLITTNDSVQEIAYAVGFNDVSYFIERFRESEGFTPARYRDNMQER